MLITLDVMSAKLISVSFCFVLFAAYAHAQVELQNERSMYSRVYLREDGQKEAVISSAPVHYNDNGVWQEINTAITPNSNGYENSTNVIRSYFPGSIGEHGKIRVVVNAQDEIFFHSQKQLVLLDDQSQLNTFAIAPGNSFAAVNANVIRYNEIYPGISDEFVVSNGAIKNNMVLSAVPGVLNNVTSGYFGFREAVELPAGWSIVASDGSHHSLTTSSLLIIDENGNEILTIPSPVFFDGNGLRPDGLNMIEGKYLVQVENNHWNIITLVPVAWLKDANTAYPVCIDPTVTIAGTTGGWQSPNNFVDNPGFVFLGVCCSNLTHRAWIKFNTTSIPDTECITNVELQVNVTTVAAAGAEAVEIYDVTGAFGPYGGIVPAAYTDFGNGYYNTFTITTTGLYGYYGLGAGANTVLQSQLPVNWFQVGMRLTNEPSTVYKIISGTTSNLRVTYGPCAPMPVELVSFDATCDNNAVNLTWTTASETDNDYFTIERTTNGIDYEIVGTVGGAGNSDVAHSYSFVDDQPLNGTSYYTLRQTDFDGQFERFRLITVNCSNAHALSVYPNPGEGIFVVDGAQPDSAIIVTDVLGQAVLQTTMTGTKTQLDLSDQPAGIYFIRTNLSGGMVTKKIVISRN